MNRLKLIMCAGAASIGLASAGAAAAQATAPAAPAPSPMPYPSVVAPMASNPYPATFDAGPLGKLTVDGVLSVDALWQSNPQPGTKAGYADITNAQVIINKTDGLFQFYVQGGAYSLPTLGTAYTRTGALDNSTFGYVPQGFIKIVPNSNFNIMVGALPTLIGAEYAFTFENMNIERGILWNLEPLVSKGVQVNFTHGPWLVSAAFTDGYYSDTYTALSGMVVYTFKSGDTLEFAAEGNVAQNRASSTVTPLQPNNGQIYNVIFSHTSGPWTITPYFQYQSTPRIVYHGVQLNPGSGSTVGGAVLTKYNFTPEFSLAGRVEYVASSGQANLLGYGTKSNVWTVTLTPTYQKGIFFVRGEVSYTGIGSGSLGSEFGPFGTESSQVRGLIETGVNF